jgi:DNA-binding NtrC family response regulator
MTRPSNNKKSRVLLVDDEANIVYLVKVGLERHDFEVDGYTDPVLALQNFKSGLYQLLVLDIKMPKMDGIDLFKRIKKEDDEVKTCFFTALEPFASNYKNLLQDYQDKFIFIQKPISIPKMIKQIEQFLSR